jgi:hypothetical protein
MDGTGPYSCVSKFDNEMGQQKGARFYTNTEKKFLGCKTNEKKALVQETLSLVGFRKIHRANCRCNKLEGGK